MTCGACLYWLKGWRTDESGRRVARFLFCARFPEYVERDADHVCGEFKSRNRPNRRSRAAARARAEKPRRRA
jgi:hypothetical protein